jgi:hypothetical protein
MFEVIQPRYIFLLELVCSLLGSQTMWLAVDGSGNKFVHRFFKTLKPIFPERKKILTNFFEILHYNTVFTTME